MKKILVVDDEFLIRYTLEEGLKDRGYDAKSAGTIEEAVECVKKFHPNVVILDNLLEHSVGMDEIATFKNMDEDIQVILMTAYGSVSQAVEATKSHDVLLAAHGDVGHAVLDLSIVSGGDVVSHVAVVPVHHVSGRSSGGTGGIDASASMLQNRQQYHSYGG